MRSRIFPCTSRITAVALAAVVFVAACGGATEQTQPEPPPGPPASIRFVSGDNQADTAMATLSSPIVVEVRDADGRLVRVAPVLFVALAVTGPNGRTDGATFCYAPDIGSCASFVFQDSAFNGRAAARVRLGPVATTVQIRATVERTNLADTATLVVRAAAPARLATFPRDSSAYVGNSYRVVGRLFDQYGNESSGPATTF